LDSIANLDGIVVRCVDRDRAITEQSFSEIDVEDRAVLFHTGWDKHWRTEEYSNGHHPFLTEGAATYLAKHGAALVGIDSFNIDSTRDGNRPAHSILLGADIPIVEHLCGLGNLPDSGFKFFAVPVKVREFGTFPVRAFAIKSA
jgi:kynurenine formamidase